MKHSVERGFIGRLFTAALALVALSAIPLSAQIQSRESVSHGESHSSSPIHGSMKSIGGAGVIGSSTPIVPLLAVGSEPTIALVLPDTVELRKTHAGKGAAIGIVAGLVYGMYKGLSSSVCDFSETPQVRVCATSVPWTLTLWGGTGGVVGYVAGKLIPRRDR